MFPVECVARGYLTGSGYKDYQATGSVSGHELPPGLVDGSQLPEPLYTPSTKAPIGEHDQNISRSDVVEQLGRAQAEELERLTLAIFRRASGIASERGILLADTKFEFGRDRDGILRLADEVLTPDSSRFWPADAWSPGKAQPSYDKQYVRDWLIESGHRGDAVELPEEVVAATRSRYVEAYERLTGASFDDYLRSV
jgi:phosphoribosylaminoimidazole-succinocarboxamide synthase